MLKDETRKSKEMKRMVHERTELPWNPNNREERGETTFSPTTEVEETTEIKKYLSKRDYETR
ncbi:hypothetical protein HYT24_03570 [Candidatus Pacearchaeota archaeon]|nr:hypothetical protein [Candidatus Pacearchaeota archaeon]